MTRRLSDNPCESPLEQVCLESQQVQILAYQVVEVEYN